MRKQEKTVLIVAVGDIVSTLIKFLLGAVTGSLALLADAWHSLGDLCTSILVLVALIFDRREATKAREVESDTRQAIIRKAGWELRVSVVIGMLLAVVAIGILQKAIYGTGLRNIRLPVIAAIIVCVLMLISYIRFRFEASVGKELGSPALVADAYHSRVDIYALGLVLISFLGEVLGLPLDRWAAVVIGCLILGVAVKIFFRSGRMLLRKSRRTTPEERSVEDNVVLVLLGTISQRTEKAKGFFVRHFRLDDPAIRKTWARNPALGICIIGILVYVSLGFYKVQHREVAVLERFGIPVNLEAPAGPGLHYFWPPPIGKVKKVDMKTIHRLRIGYESQEGKELILWTNVHYIRRYSLLTGDNTFLDIAASLHYRIRNAPEFLYSSANPEEILEAVVYRVIREVVGTRKFFPLLTDWRKELEGEIKKQSQQIVDALNLGVKIVAIYCRDLHPPLEVAMSFEEVVSAQEDMETFIEEARGYQKEMLPIAQGEASTRIEQAKAEKTTAVKTAFGKAAAFKSVEQAFQSNKEINQFRLRLETLESALENVDKFVVDKKSSSHPVDLFMDMSGTTGSSVSRLAIDERGDTP